MGARGDVEKNHFVGALFIIAHRQFHGVAHVPQLAGLGLAELDPTRDLAVMNVQARNNTFRNHHVIENAARPKAKENDAMPPISGALPAAKPNPSAYPVAGVPVPNQLQKKRNTTYGIRIANNPFL
jgi:hypothetical protein